MPAREWSVRAHEAAERLLPADERGALTTDMLSAEGKPVDVYQRFRLDRDSLDDLLGNLEGLEESAQVSSPSASLGDSNSARRRWAGFEDVEVPASGGAVLYARLASPEKANEIPGSYVILIHGLFGTIDSVDMQNHIEALRQAGHHVLAIEMRGHGQTAVDHPEYCVTFGIEESSDLIAAANWLKESRHATRVGLVTFSLSGYEALLTAWLDGQAAVTDFRDVPLMANLPVPGKEPAFNGGMFIVSAPVDVVATADSFDERYNLLDAPLKSTFQKHVANRLKQYHQTGYSLWDLAHGEFERSGWEQRYGTFATLKPDFIRFVDMSADNWQQGAARMENVRTPILVLNAANDPLQTAQAVADLFGRVKNPNIGVLVLKGGGHMGFAAMSADYYYSLMLNFFDPKTGPAAVNPLTYAAQRRLTRASPPSGK